MRTLLPLLVVAGAVACGDGGGATLPPTPDAPAGDTAATDSTPDVATAPDTGLPPLDDASAPDAVSTPDVAAQDADDDAPPTLDAPPDAADDAPTTADVPATADAPVAADAPADVAGDAPSSCPAPPACNAAPPPLGATTSWRHLTTRLTVALGSARHRGRDLLLREGDAQWALAKFAYGLNDDDLNDEDVDIYLLRDCARWERLGTAATSRDSAPHAAVEGVADSGGRVYVQIPAAQRLGVGWHRLLFVVRGDHTTATQWINVVPATARVVVTDVDGTLTESENAAFTALFTGPPPAANPGGADMLRALVDRGYQVMYLTARPEWLEPTTHQWLTLRGFPRGIVHTTLGLTGALGGAAETFKTEELRALRTRFMRSPDYGFGNTDSDVAAYVAGMVPTAGSFYYRFGGNLRGGARVDDYNTLVPRFRALPAVCR